MKELNKAGIETVARAIIDVLKKDGLADALCVYYNNKRISFNEHWDTDSIYPEYKEVVKDNIDPHDYFEYAAYHHIISISTEGGLYDRLNYGEGCFPEELEELFDKVGIYYELGNSWNLSFYPSDDDLKVEYTEYDKPVPPTFIWLNSNCAEIPDSVRPIMEEWYKKSTDTGDIGCCVIGAHLGFTLKGVKYEMAPCSPWQGEGSWIPHVEWVKEELKKVGATELYWSCGMLD